MNDDKTSELNLIQEMPKNSKTIKRSLNVRDGVIECICGATFNYNGERKGEIIMRIHNKVCPQQVRGHYSIEDTLERIKLTYDR